MSTDFATSQKLKSTLPLDWDTTCSRKAASVLPPLQIEYQHGVNERQRRAHVQ